MQRKKERKKVSEHITLLQPFKVVETWSTTEKNAYYAKLQQTTRNYGRNSNKCNRTISFIAPLLRHFPIEIRNEENIPLDTEVIFVVNHSNSHDLFVIREVMTKLHRPETILTAWDGLNVFSRFLFFIWDATFIERSNKVSVEKGILRFSGKILNGKNGIIFGEATWNLHPTLPMQKVKAGAVQISLITQKPIVPVIMEYIEYPQQLKKEQDLYAKCVITFGKPIYSSIEKNIFLQTQEIQNIMESMRRRLWKEFNISKKCEDSTNQSLYLNHLYLKKYKAMGFQYITEHESKFLLEKENEYTLDSDGSFVPGILEK